MTVVRFTLDEPLFPPHDALPGLLTALEIDDLEHEWKATKIDEWCAVAALGRAAASVRHAVGVPDDAPIAYALARATWRGVSCRPMVRRAVAAYQDAATRYEEVRVDLEAIRRRAYARPAA